MKYRPVPRSPEPQRDQQILGENRITGEGEEAIAPSIPLIVAIMPRGKVEFTKRSLVSKKQQQYTSINIRLAERQTPNPRHPLPHCPEA
jgi:hypothetical protein